MYIGLAVLCDVLAVKKWLNVNRQDLLGRNITVTTLDEITLSPGSKVRVRSHIGYTVATLNKITHSSGLKVRVRSHIL